jgi:hypothetical protein
MTAQASSNIDIWLTTGSATSVAMTAAPTQAKPSVVGCSTTGIVDGDLVIPRATSMGSLDNLPYCADDPSGTDLKLLGSDASADPAGQQGTLDHYDATAVTKLCLASLSMSASEPSTVGVGTYCDPTASLPSAVVEAGTMSFTGYVDINSADYVALYEASLKQDQRYIRIDLVKYGEQGYLVAPVTVSAFTWDLPLEGAIGYNGTFVLGSKVRHLF